MQVIHHNAAGNTLQATYAVAVGYQAGNISQGSTSVAMGYNVGQNAQGTNAVAIGNNTAVNYQGASGVAIGTNSGNTSQGSQAVAIGRAAGFTVQGAQAIAVGWLAGQINQGASAVAVGFYAGQSYQGSNAVALGNNAANTSQGSSAVAIGNNAAQTSQGSSAVAIGYNTAQYYQGSNAVALGNNAGNNSQGSNAIAIGNNAGQTSQHTNSIILNAGSSALNSGTAGAFYVNPVRNVAQVNMLGYDTTAKEITYFSFSNHTSTNIVSTNISSGTLYATSNIKSGAGTLGPSFVLQKSYIDISSGSASTYTSYTSANSILFTEDGNLGTNGAIGGLTGFGVLSDGSNDNISWNYARLIMRGSGVKMATATTGNTIVLQPYAIQSTTGTLITQSSFTVTDEGTSRGYRTWISPWFSTNLVSDCQSLGIRALSFNGSDGGVVRIGSTSIQFKS